MVECYVDDNRIGNMMTDRYHTGIIIYLKNVPIVWYSKRKNTLESSSFGSEFVVLRIATDMVEALRYELQMFGVKLDGLAYMFCDNQSVDKNASIPTSVLNKRHNTIYYHRVREV